MKISDLLDYVDEIMHNVFSVKTKLRWINQLEAEVQTEVLLLTAEGITQYTEDDFSAELLVPAPHDQIYQNYLMWQIALAQGEDRANNLAEQFNRVWYAYLRFAKETINPGAGIADKVRYYLTAYQIAVKLGYTGTETEWVKSLRGADGEPGAGLNIADQVATEADLPSGSDLEKGTGYLVGEDNEALLYIWNGTDWFYKQKLSGEGKQGEPGPAGDPGVYVSETEPTDPDAVVWINPAGEATPGGGGGGSVDLTGYAKETWVTEQLKSYAKEADIPTKTSQLTNDSNFLTEHQSLEGYATEDYVKAKIAEAELGGGEGGEGVDLSGYALKSDLPTKTSQLTNDSGYLTAVPEGYAKTEDIPTKTSQLTNDSGYLTAVPEGYAKTEDIPTKTSQLTNDSGYLTEHQSLAEYAKKEEIPTELAELTEDETHRTVTDAEIEAWNAKSDFSGDFDDLTDKPILCNPNLLDNWYFINPVNQRGFTSEAATTSLGYHIDRWTRSGYSSGVISVGADGLTVDGTATTTGANQIYQKLENALPENTYTLSILVAALTGTGSLNIANSSGDSLKSGTMTEPGLYSITYTGANVGRIFCGARACSSITITAIKLELGAQQTLAHQDASGNWVLNEIPNYAEQLARCQRYQLRVGHREGSNYANPIGFGYANATAEHVRVFIPTPQTMRANPTPVFFGTATMQSLELVGADGTAHAVTAITRVAYGNGVLYVCAASDLVAGTIYLLRTNSISGLLLDANL